MFKQINRIEAKLDELLAIWAEPKTGTVKSDMAKLREAGHITKRFIRHDNCPARVEDRVTDTGLYCYRCGVHKLFRYFHRDNSAQSGHQGTCVKCVTRIRVANIKRNKHGQ